MLKFKRLEWASFLHSAVYLALLYEVLLGGHAEPATLIFGYAHGIAWIVMSLATIAAARRRVIPLHVAVAVAVLGAVGPMIGSAAFVIEERRRARGSTRDPRPPG